MKDVLTEELAAIRRVRMERLKELMRALEEGQLTSDGEGSTSDSGSGLHGALPEDPTTRLRLPR